MNICSPVLFNMMLRKSDKFSTEPCILAFFNNLFYNFKITYLVFWYTGNILCMLHNKDIKNKQQLQIA